MGQPVFLYFLLVFLGITAHSANLQNKPSFQNWIQSFKEKAKKRGISPKTLDAAFCKVDQPLEHVLSLDRHQPEIKKTFDEYYDKHIPALAPKGKMLFKKHQKLLTKIHKKYGVPPVIILALWGRETNYGRITGKTPVIHALATLAYDGRREQLFTQELFHALHIAEESNLNPTSLIGSWAGAMGHCQFMPSSFRSHAVDETGKGHKDIWNTLDDVFGSTANFLKNLGWQAKEPWVIEVQVPPSYSPLTLSESLHHKKPLSYWKGIGIKPLSNKAFPKSSMHAALICPEKSTRCFLVFDNIHVILKWNRSMNFALSVGMLANKINDGELDYDA